MKTEFLTKLFLNKSLISICTTRQKQGEILVGFIVEMTDKYIILNEIDIYATFIGKTHIKIDDIIHIQTNSAYLFDLQSLLNTNFTINPNCTVTIWGEDPEIIPHIKLLRENKTIATLFFDEYENSGIIINCDNNIVQMNNIDDSGNINGISYHPLSNIKGLSYDGVIEQKLKHLYDTDHLDLRSI